MEEFEYWSNEEQVKQVNKTIKYIRKYLETEDWEIKTGVKYDAPNLKLATANKYMLFFRFPTNNDSKIYIDLHYKDGNTVEYITADTSGVFTEGDLVRFRMKIEELQKK